MGMNVQQVKDGVEKYTLILIDWFGVAVGGRKVID